MLHLELNADTDAAYLRDRLGELFGLSAAAANDIEVNRLESGYEIRYFGELAGIDFPELEWVKNIQELIVNAAGGGLSLRVQGLGTRAGFSDSENVSRQLDFAVLNIDEISTTSAATMKALQSELFDLDAAEQADFDVRRSANTWTMTYGGDLIGTSIPELIWNETPENTQLEPFGMPITVTSSLQPDGQSFTVGAESGTYTMRVGRLRL